MNFKIINNKADDNYILLIAMEGFLVNNAFYYSKEQLVYFNYLLSDFLTHLKDSGIKKQGIFEEIQEYNDIIKIKNDRKFSGKYLLILFPNDNCNFGYWLSQRELISLKFEIEKGLSIIGMVRARANL
jgi:hypothetical protein